MASRALLTQKERHRGQWKANWIVERDTKSLRKEMGWRKEKFGTRKTRRNQETDELIGRT